MFATATATATVALALTLALAGARAAEAAALRAPWEGAGEPPPAAPAAALLPPSAYVHELALAPGRPRHRRSPAPEPSVDPSEDVPTHWRPHNAPKAQFVTKQQPAPASPSTTYPSSDDTASARFNEIPLPDRSPMPAAYAYSRSRYDPAPPRPYTRYDAPFTAPYGSRAGASAPQRRIVYYADLPDVVRPSQRAPLAGYDAPRDAYDAFGRRGGGDAYYRYRPHASDRSLPPPPAPSSYAILDAERAAPPPPPPLPYAPYPGDARYQRVPAPYVQRSALSAGPSPVPYNGGGNARLSVAPNRFSEPYRDYNPRQPAPWSMQVGTRLTVNDDERSPLGAGRRFYVQSQEQGAGAGAGYGPYAPLPPSRYSRLDDDPRRRL